MEQERTHKASSRASRAKTRKPQRRVYHRGPAIADEAGLRERGRGLRPKTRTWLKCWSRSAGRRRFGAGAGFAGLAAHHRFAAGLGRQRKRHLRPAQQADRAARSRRLVAKRRRRSCAAAGCRRQESARFGRSPRRSPKARPRSGRSVGARRRGRAQEAGRRQRGRPVDGGHFSSVLPRPPGCFSRRRSRASGGREARAQAQMPARRAAAREDCRALAALARRRRPHALGLLPGGEGALGDGPRRWFRLSG